jgi:hypothetical protein
MSLSRHQEEFETTISGCHFLLRDLGGNLVKGFVSREALVHRATTDVVELDADFSLKQLAQLFDRYRLEIEGIASTGTKAVSAEPASTMPW